MVVSVIHDMLRRNISGGRLAQAEEATGRLCLEGQRAVAVLLVSAEQAGKFAEAVRMLNEYWERRWQRQHPVHCGDPDFADNAVCYGMIYERLRLPLPGF